MVEYFDKIWGVRKFYEIVCYCEEIELLVDEVIDILMN